MLKQSYFFFGGGGGFSTCISEISVLMLDVGIFLGLLVDLLDVFQK